MTAINLEQISSSLKHFMKMKEHEVAERFSSLPKAKRYLYLEDRPQHPIVFVPGSRKDRVLLVAHYDTVFDDAELDIRQHGAVIYSGQDKIGIGADDRIGCALLWAMRSLGHSLLLLPDEEVGCKGSRALVENYPNLLKNHGFMLQFDRKGSHDMAHYGFENKELYDYMKKFYPQYRETRGSSTDIAVLMKASNIPGFNLSIGFVNEHTSREYVDVFNYIRTATCTRTMLSQKVGGIPAFEGEIPLIKTYGTYAGGYNSGGYTGGSTAKKASKPQTTTASGTFRNRGKAISSWKKPPFKTAEQEENEVDGYTREAKLRVSLSKTSPKYTIVIYENNQEVKSFATDKTQELVRKLQGNLLNKAIWKYGTQTKLPCHHCKANIAPSLLFHCLDGRILCGLCSNEAFTPPDSLVKQFEDYHRDLLRTYHDSSKTKEGTKELAIAN